MNLDEQDLKHCHKVLTSDVGECNILLEDSTGGRAERLQKRIEDDRRVLARIERITGYAPAYETIQEGDIPSETSEVSDNTQ